MAVFEKVGSETDADLREAAVETASEPPERSWLRWIDRLVVAACIAGGVVLRFVALTPLWLDESLSVNIAKLPIDQIPGALRHDGHPPLFYVLLHYWMDVFGDSDVAVRALSGIFALALLPLIWIAANRIAGRRAAWLATAVTAICPFTIRYGTETRMYALVMLLALVGWLLVADALERPTPARLVAITLVAAGLLYSHYWGMWLLAAAAVGLLWERRKAARARRDQERRAITRVIGALVAGGVLFLPWAPILLYQGAHTGTPWGDVVYPSGVIANTLADIGGGATAEAVVFGGACAVLAMVAIFCRPLSRRFLEVDLWTRPDSRPLLFVFSATLAFAMVFGYATKSTFVTRYTAVVFPFFMLLVGIGLTRFLWAPMVRMIMVVLIVLGGIGAIRTSVIDQRTEARADAQEITKTIRPNDVIAYCPDQLGPAVWREIDRKGRFDQVTYPDFKPPERVDWVDYVARINAVDPGTFARQLLQRAGDRQIYLVWSDQYQKTHHDRCRVLAETLASLRPHEALLPLQGDKYYEPSTVWRFPSPTG